MSEIPTYTVPVPTGTFYSQPTEAPLIPAPSPKVAISPLTAMLIGFAILISILVCATILLLRNVGGLSPSKSFSRRTDSQRKYKAIYPAPKIVQIGLDENDNNKRQNGNAEYKNDNNQRQSKNVDYKNDNNQRQNGNVEYKNDNNQQQNGNVEYKNDNNQRQNGNVEYKNDNNQQQNGNVEYKNDNNQRQSKNVEYKNDHNRRQNANVEYKNDNNQRHNGNVEYKNDNNQQQNGNVEYKNDNNQRQSKNVEYKNDNNQQQNGNVEYKNDNNQRQSKNVEYKNDNNQQQNGNVEYKNDNNQRQSKNVEYKNDHNRRQNANVEYKNDNNQQQNGNVEYKNDNNRRQSKNVEYKNDNNQQQNGNVEYKNDNNQRQNGIVEYDGNSSYKCYPSSQVDKKANEAVSRGPIDTDLEYSQISRSKQDPLEHMKYYSKTPALNGYGHKTFHYKNIPKASNHHVNHQTLNHGRDSKTKEVPKMKGWEILRNASYYGKNVGRIYGVQIGDRHGYNSNSHDFESDVSSSAYISSAPGSYDKLTTVGYEVTSNSNGSEPFQDVDNYKKTFNEVKDDASEIRSNSIQSYKSSDSVKHYEDSFRNW
jgi:hypothetical protein